MTGIVVSYARGDVRFAQELRAALAEHGHEVWLDIDEIEPGDDWLASIERALEEAGAVVFVATPESLRSQMCMRELRLAATHGRPIVAVARGHVGEGPLPDELAGAEWIDIGRDDDFAPVLLRLNARRARPGRRVRLPGRGHGD